MSYCVNCGVELESSAKECPLCNAPVLNPFIDDNDETISTYSNNVFIPKSVSKRYVSFIISVMLLIPNIVCSITNLILPETGTWAIFVNASSLLCFILFLMPLLFRKVNPYILLFIDTAAVTLYIYFFYLMFDEHNWFFFVAMPMVIALGIIIACFLAWTYKKQRQWPYIMIALLTNISIYAVFTELILHFYYETASPLRYSIIIVVSCICINIFFLFIAKNQKFRNWLAKRFFV